jgi:hypothetical protein
MLFGILEDRRYITRRVQDPQDLKWPRSGIVDDEIREHRPELDRLIGEVVAQMADAGLTARNWRAFRISRSTWRATETPACSTRYDLMRSRSCAAGSDSR